MRNGIYRVWLNGPNGRGKGAVVFKDGDVLACDHSFAYTGRYAEKNGTLTADVRCKRLIQRTAPVHLPDLDEFHLELEGAAGREFAILTGTIPEAPGFSLSLEYAWLCDA